MSKRQPLYATLAALAVLGGFYTMGGTGPVFPKTAPNLPKTPAVQNIENRYSAGGGSKDHLPGAASPLGRSDLVEGRNQGTTGMANAKFRKQLEEQQHDNAVVTRTNPPEETRKLKPQS